MTLKLDNYSLIVDTAKYLSKFQNKIYIAEDKLQEYHGLHNTN